MKNTEKQTSAFIWSTNNLEFAPLNLKEKIAELSAIVKVLIQTHPALNKQAALL